MLENKNVKRFLKVSDRRNVGELRVYASRNPQDVIDFGWLGTSCRRLLQSDLQKASVRGSVAFWPRALRIAPRALLEAQRDEGIDARGAAGGYVASQQGDGHEQDGDGDVGYGVPDFDTIEKS